MLLEEYIWVIQFFVLLLQYVGILRINMNLYVLYINYTQKHNFEICFLIFALWILLGINFCLRHFLSGPYFKTYIFYEANSKQIFKWLVYHKFNTDRNGILHRMIFFISRIRSLLYKNWHSNYIWIWTLIAGRRGELISILYTIIWRKLCHKITYF